jgi:hypothetical protein
MNFEDITARPIDIGDIILYTMSTDGRAARMEAGEVVRFNPKSIVVQPVHPVSFSPIQVDEYYMENDGPPKVQYPGQPYERIYQPKRRVVTGQRDCDTQLIPKPESYRFYILKKV